MNNTNNTNDFNNEIKEVYREDTIGRRYHNNIVSKHSMSGTVNKVADTDVTAINLDKPINIKEFMKLSDSLKVLYITTIVKKYEASWQKIADMMGCSKNYVYAHIVKPLNLFKLSNKGKQMNREQQMCWGEFCNQGKVIEEAPIPVSEVETADTVKCNPKSVSIKLEGVLDYDAVLKKVREMLMLMDEGTNYSLALYVETLNGGNVCTL